MHEPSHEKNNHLGFRLGPIQTDMYIYRIWIEARNFRSKKKRNLLSVLQKQRHSVTAQLICAFVFAYACYLFSNALAHISIDMYTYEFDLNG